MNLNRPKRCIKACVRATECDRAGKAVERDDHLDVAYAWLEKSNFEWYAKHIYDATIKACKG